MRLQYRGSGALTAYRLRVEGLSPLVGGGVDSVLGGATPFGLLLPGKVRAVTDRAGDDDVLDYYQFTLDRPLRVDLKLYELTEDVDLTLLDSAGRVLAASTNAAVAAERITLDLSPGLYYAKVRWTGVFATDYRLRVAAA
jgi:hypothetical protein